MGEATLKAYVKAGANVVGMDISDQKGKDISLNANNISFIHIDVSDKDSVKNAFDLALDELKTLDVLAHPAAIQGPADASDVKVEDWDNMFAVNVRGTMLTNQTAFKYMKKNGSGSIINFGSISGLISFVDKNSGGNMGKV